MSPTDGVEDLFLYPYESLGVDNHVSTVPVRLTQVEVSTVKVLP